MRQGNEKVGRWGETVGLWNETLRFYCHSKEMRTDWMNQKSLSVGTNEKTLHLGCGVHRRKIVRDRKASIAYACKQPQTAAPFSFVVIRFILVLSLTQVSVL